MVSINKGTKHKRNTILINLSTSQGSFEHPWLVPCLEPLSVRSRMIARSGVFWLDPINPRRRLSSNFGERDTPVIWLVCVELYKPRFSWNLPKYLLSFGSLGWGVLNKVFVSAGTYGITPPISIGVYRIYSSSFVKSTE